MKDFEDVISRIQSSIPNFTANYRCEDCLSRGGLPTEEEIEAKKKERIKKRSVAFGAVDWHLWSLDHVTPRS